MQREKEADTQNCYMASASENTDLVAAAGSDPCCRMAGGRATPILIRLLAPGTAVIAKAVGGPPVARDMRFAAIACVLLVAAVPPTALLRMFVELAFIGPSVIRLLFKVAMTVNKSSKRPTV